MMRTSALCGVAGRKAAQRAPFNAAVLGLSAPHQRMLLSATKPNQFGLAQVACRQFSDAAAVMSQQDDGEVDTRDENARLGVDTEFSQQKHAYVLTFPWNFDEIIDDF